MMRHRACALSMVVVTLLVAAVGQPAWLPVLLTEAQAQTPPSDTLSVIELPVIVLDCAQPPSAVAVGELYVRGVVPSACDPVQGIAITIEVEESGESARTLVTDAAGRVSVQIALNSRVVVGIDPNDAPRSSALLTEEVQGVVYANPLVLDPVAESDRWGLLFVIAPRTSKPTDARAAEDARNLGVIRTLYEQVYSDGNLALIDELYAPDYVERQKNLPSGRDGVHSAIAALLMSFPDLQVVIDDMAAHDDIVWVRATMRGTNLGEIFGIPATGESVEVYWFDVYRLDEGRIVAHWGVGDELTMLQQLGFRIAMPEPAPAP